LYDNEESGDLSSVADLWNAEKKKNSDSSDSSDAGSNNPLDTSIVDEDPILSDFHSQSDDIRGIPMTAGSAERWLNSKNHSMRTLVVLCRGILNDDGSQILDIMMDPWRLLPLNTIKPKSEEYKVEIKRRWEQFNSEGAKKKKPKPTQWNIDKCLKWLDNHPITNETDIAFLQQTVSLWIKFANDAATQERI
jgi:hypothetical protein